MSQIVFDIAVEFLQLSKAHQALLQGLANRNSIAVTDISSFCQSFDYLLTDDQIEEAKKDGCFKFYLIPLIGYGLAEESEGFCMVTQQGRWALRSVV